SVPSRRIEAGAPKLEGVFNEALWRAVKGGRVHRWQPNVDDKATHKQLSIAADWASNGLHLTVATAGTSYVHVAERCPTCRRAAP
ncbi:MAG TPA: hypothetical protein VLT33_12340, partial [Labilithrix sp.]|nr:hypothetical protein [Labilithrix sp.]